ncbi:MAG: HflC protein [SAR202 cluster bacterium Io17-Chloro-G9]|nr:MAG: HflC protein [SAR202 cluster bacterium Io17-Chloro-G9]
MKTLIVVGVILVIALILINTALYVVDEREQVIITRFGEVQTVSRASGLYLKVPFVDTATSYDRRVLRIDAPPERMLDRDINILEIDAYARYQIIDPVQFRKTLQSEQNARRVLGQRINAALRAEVAERSREQIIGGDVELDAEGNPVTDDEGNSQVSATENRAIMLSEVRTAIRDELDAEPESFGIVMHDVRIKRADFPGEVSGRVFERMRSDREKIGRQLRAEGEEESRRRRARADRTVEVILAEADQEANRLRGEGEAEAINILSEALNEDPEFFAFQRSLEAYRSFLNQQTTVILSSEADIFKFLQGPGVAP